MASYATSTQLAHWTFTPLALSRLRTEANERARARLAGAPDSLPGADGDSNGSGRRGGGGASTAAGAGADAAGAELAVTVGEVSRKEAATPPPPPPASPTPGSKRRHADSDDEDGDDDMDGGGGDGAGAGGGSGDGASHSAKKRQMERARREGSAQPLTVAEEAVLRRFFECQVAELCRDALGFEPTLCATAVSVFKRFYVRNSLMDIDPRKAVVVAVFIAIKLEACPFSERIPFSKKLKRELGVEDEALTELEIPVLLSLRYHLSFYHPYRALRAFAADLHSEAASAGDAASAEAAAAAINSIASEAEELAAVSLTTDCTLTFSPAQIALACLRLGARNVEEAAASGVDVEGFAERVMAAAGPGLRDETAAAVEAAAALIAAADEKPTAKDLAAEAKPLHKRATRCLDPAYQPGTPEYKARAAARLERLAEQKRARVGQKQIVKAQRREVLVAERKAAQAAAAAKAEAEAGIAT